MKKDLFRAKLKESGEWVYWDTFGHLCRESGKQQTLVIKTKHGELHYRYVNDIECRIDRNTVCKWIGLFDKKRKRIFTGNIVRGYNTFHEREEQYVSAWEDNGFYLFDDCGSGWHPEHIAKLEVIGNIYDNPELLKGDNDAN